jgi:hypothetical protein
MAIQKNKTTRSRKSLWPGECVTLSGEPLRDIEWQFRIETVVKELYQWSHQLPTDPFPSLPALVEAPTTQQNGASHEEFSNARAS